jgi:hypothetical protein
MSLLLLLPLLLTAPAVTEVPVDCGEIAVILLEAVEEGFISINEADDISARCARAADL